MDSVTGKILFSSFQLVLLHYLLLQMDNEVQIGKKNKKTIPTLLNGAISTFK